MQDSLPRQLTSFVGRRREISQVEELLRTSRLLTLTGTGGCGKTRLALQVAGGLGEVYPDGVWFVELAPLADPRLVPQTVASILNLHEEGSDIEAALAGCLRTSRALLVLDNCEHLLGACASLACTLLRECPDLRILATSRQALGLSEELETVWDLPSLPVPDLAHLPAFTDLLQNEAVELFAERAFFSRPGFKLTPGNGPAVAELCVRLEGIPLAIELAASRVKVLSVEQIVQRMRGFHLLVTGEAMAEASTPRHQTLAAMIDWSYELLSEREQALLRGLSVFAGSASIEAAAAVCAPGAAEHDVINLLSGLADRSLLGVDEHAGAARYRLLETIRQYAWEKLCAEGEDIEMRTRHMEWYVELAETARPLLITEQQPIWLQRLELEHDNLRAALEWSTSEECGTRDAGCAEVGLRMAGALWRFWYLHGHTAEGLGWLQTALERGGEVAAAVRARVLNATGNMLGEMGDYDGAEIYYGAALQIRRELGDKLAIVGTLNNLGVAARNHGDYDRAIRLYAEALDICEGIGDKEGIASLLDNIGFLMQCKGDTVRAVQYQQRALTLFKELGDRSGISMALNNLGEAQQSQGKLEKAAATYEEALAIAREIGFRGHIVSTLNNLASVALLRRDLARAAGLYSESLELCRQVEQKHYLAESLEGAAAVIVRAHYRQAAQLLGCATALRERIHVPISPHKKAAYERTCHAARSNQKERIFDTAWAEGRGLKNSEAIELALTELAAVPEQTLMVTLTKQQMVVLGYVAQGLGDAEIAARLNCSPRTVQSHLHHVFDKLQVTSRGAAAHYYSTHYL